MSAFKNKVVVVTGGNSGIGKAIAEKFDEEGAKVAIFGRDQNKLDQALKKLKQGIAVSGDVTKISDLNALFETTQNKLGKIDVLVANAGIASSQLVDDVDEKHFDEMVNINFKGVYFTVRRAISYLNDNASIILISSMAAHGGWRALSVYSATKAAISMLARNFSADLMHRGIRVNAISPGYTDTPMYDSISIKKISPSIPAKRFAKPEEIAEAAIYLSSPKASYIVGIDLVIDGGFTAIMKD